MGDQKLLAPWPYVDRYPTIVGQNASLTYLAAVSRLALSGYRQQYVDFLDELLEKSPHAYGVCAKRFETVACGILDVTPPKLEDQGRQKLADAYAEFVRNDILAIPMLTERLGALMWAEFYGVTASEIAWDRDGTGWHVAGLNMVHSRRLAYPELGSWDLHIWDQGPISAAPWGSGRYPSEQVFGFRIKDYPGKFVVHSPQLRGDYPTREGFGREIGTWILLQLIASRGASQYLERFAKPWPEAIYSTREEGNDNKGRAATDEEVAEAQAAIQALGVGANAGYTHSDAIEVKLTTPDQSGAQGKISYEQWIAICDAQISKAVLSATLTTEVGSSGSRAVADTQKEGEDKRFEYSARALAATLKRDLVTPLVRLNFGDVPRDLFPNVIIRTGEEPDPALILDKAIKAANVGMPVDADAIADLVGLPLIPKVGTEARRLYPAKPHDFSPPPEVLGLPEPVEPEPDTAGGDNATDDTKPEEEPLEQ